MLKSSLWDYSDAFIPVCWNNTVEKTEEPETPNNKKIHLLFKNCASFTNYISKINNTQIGNAIDIDVVMQMHHLIEYIDNYSQTSESSWQYYRNEPALTDAGAIANFFGNSALLMHQVLKGQKYWNNGDIKIFK